MYVFIALKLLLLEPHCIRLNGFQVESGVKLTESSLQVDFGTMVLTRCFGSEYLMHTYLMHIHKWSGSEFICLGLINH